MTAGPCTRVTSHGSTRRSYPVARAAGCPRSYSSPVDPLDQGSLGTFTVNIHPDSTRLSVRREGQ
jgi:hypothetical protein